MKQGNIFLQILLSLRINPLLKVDKIKGMFIMDSLRLKPLCEKWEILVYFLPVEYSVYHMATKQPHLYLVPYMTVYVLVLVNVLENVRSC